MNARIRKFRLDDLDEILEIEKFSFPKSPYSRETFLTWYKIAPNCFFVAEHEGKIVGYILGHAMDKKGIVASIAVYPAFRRKGIGTKLWQRLLQHFNEIGVERVELEVRKSNVGAQKFYEKMGFKKVGIREGYYQNGEDAIVMEYKL